MVKTKTLSLNISERLSGLSILNGFKGNLDTLAAILEDVRKFTIVTEEWTKAEKKETSSVGADGQPTINWSWDNEKGGSKDIEISDTTAEFMLKDIGAKDKAGEFTLQDMPYITLKNKLK